MEESVEITLMSESLESPNVKESTVPKTRTLPQRSQGWSPSGELTTTCRRVWSPPP